MSSGRAEPRRGPSAFWVAALLGALVRALVAASRVDELELELYSGSLGQALAHGMPLDPHQLPVIPHNRGSVVFGALLAPAFWLFGPRLWVIKALAVAMSAATAGLLAWLTERHVSRRAGLAAALLLALLPPSYQMVDVLALASHGDSVLFTALALALLLGPGPERGPLETGRALALGLVVGFGCFFSLQCLVAVPALLASWLARDPAFWRRPASLGALAAALVWVVPAERMLGDAGGATIVNQSASERMLPEGLLGALAKWLGTFAVELRRSWMFELHGGSWAGWLLLAALAAGLAAVVPRLLRLEPLLLFSVLYPALIAGAYAVTNFRLELDRNLDGMGSRYLMPMIPFMALWVAAALERGPSRWPPAPLGRAAVLAAAAAGLVGWLALLDPGKPWRQPTVRATELAYFHGHLEHAAGSDPAERLAWIERLEPDWPAWRPLIHSVVRLPAAEAGTSAQRIDAIRAAPEDVRPYLWVLLGHQLAEEPLAELPALGLAPDEQRWLLRGTGVQLLRNHIARSTRQEAAAARRGVAPAHAPAALFARLGDELERLDPAAREALLEGLGFQVGLRLTVYQPVLLRVVEETEVLAPVHAAVLDRAMGVGFRMRFLEADYRLPERLSIEAHLSERARAPFRAGLAPDA